MSKEIRLRKGLTINLVGEASKAYGNIKEDHKFVVKPTDFHGLTPKLKVKVGDTVKAGSVLFFDKYSDQVNFCSPVSGTVTEVTRGAKRRILEVEIASDGDMTYESYPKAMAGDLSREEIISHMLAGGVWPFIKQKPYDIIANPADTPKAIFISAFKSSPLCIDNNFAMEGTDELFQKGLDFITKLTEGTTHLTVSGNKGAASVFTNAKGVQINKIKGRHPAGNVGIQIHHIDPINKGDIVWHIAPQDVLVIGRLFSEGKYDVSRVVCLAGSQVENPQYYRTIAGARVSNMLENNVKAGTNRYISGDVLTGKRIEADGHLGFYDTEVTVLPEGDEPEFLGWMKPGFDKFSVSKTFLTYLTPNKKFALNTNMHGEERAYVMSGHYEKVLPMDIFPVHLIKAIMVEDVELMENLGIYEVAPEDFALCEFVCTSKVNVQDLIRHGLDVVRKETS